ncbi:MAG: TetR/AcrR family transcriptional regulator [Candidatus Heimdallarchaeota archaeon]|nr:TetR/AcrR family transcriptional regulator [Candidatus Heimdallarchaeota archaeon]
MGRTKVFKPEIAVKIAMFVFWKNGYEATSMDDLLKAMNISRSSFYDTFGNKENLYIQTINFFATMSDYSWHQFTLRSKEDASLAEIVRQFTGARITQVMNPDLQGCYAANSALELGGHIKEVQISSKKFFDMYREAFEFCLTNAQKKGEISDHHNLSSTALYLVNAISGLSVLAKSGSSVEEIDSIIKATLSIFKDFSSELYAKTIKDVEKKYLPKMLDMMEKYPEIDV